MTDIARVAEFLVALPDGANYSAHDDENLLNAAQRAQWLVRYGCRNGNCEACTARLLKGRVELRNGDIIEAPAESILLCLCTARSDLTIALASDPRPGSFDQSLRSYARLVRQDIDGDASVLYFALPAGRQPAVLAEHIALIETAAGLLQGHIDVALSQHRQLRVKLRFASPLNEGEYYHVRYPLSTTSAQEHRNE